jgi:hypothetical protein
MTAASMQRISESLSPGLEKISAQVDDDQGTKRSQATESLGRIGPFKYESRHSKIDYWKCSYASHQRLDMWRSKVFKSQTIPFFWREPVSGVVYVKREEEPVTYAADKMK